MLRLTFDRTRGAALTAALLMLALMLPVGSAAAQDSPFLGVVVEDNVPVRAGASPAYYVVGELARGDRVQVREILYGWNRIAVPEGFHSYISKGFVDVRGDGKIGVVGRDAAKVKAGSIKGPGESYRTQLALNQGDQVQIIGEEGSFYRIVPPSGASVFVRPGAIQRAEQAMQPAAPEPAAPAPQPEPQPQQPRSERAPRAQAGNVPEVEYAQPVAMDEPADDTADTQRAPAVDVASIDPSQMVPARAEEADDAPADDEAGTEAASVGAAEKAAQTADAVAEQAEDLAEVTTQPVDEPTAPQLDAAKGLGGDATQTPAQSPELRALEARAIPQMLQPVEQQPIDELIAAYQQLSGNDQLPAIDQQVIAIRLAALQRNQQLAQAIREIAAAREVSDQRAAQRSPVEDFDQPTKYDLTGQLMASSVYNGVNLPLMYRLVDTATGRTLAYIKPDDAADARSLLGRQVGVQGATQYDPVLKLNVVNVSTLDPLITTR
jgi:uncharacterized protein YgiM (DUF1202 family)